MKIDVRRFREYYWIEVGQMRESCDQSIHSNMGGFSLNWPRAGPKVGYIWVCPGSSLSSARGGEVEVEWTSYSLRRSRITRLPVAGQSNRRTGPSSGTGQQTHKHFIFEPARLIGPSGAGRT